MILTNQLINFIINIIPQMEIEKIELNKVFVELLAPNLVLLSLKDNITIEVEDIIEIKDINTKLTNGNNYGLITNSGNYTSISNEARKLTANKEMEGKRIAMSIIINSLSQRMLVNFYLKINKPSIPTKSFSNLKDSREWIEKQLNNSSNTL